MPLPQTFEARHVETRVLTPTVSELVFERLDGRPMEFEAGQWVRAALPLMRPDGQTSVGRAYSIASAPSTSGRFEIAVTRVPGGPGSTWLHGLEPGNELQFVGPQGIFKRSAADASPCLMIAAGTGVTPFRAMMGSALSAHSRSPLWLLFGAPDGDEIPYGDEFRELASRYPSIRFEPTLSRASPGWTRRRGPVEDHVKSLWQELAALGGVPRAYVCGLHAMVRRVRDVLRNELGVPQSQVHVERYD